MLFEALTGRLPFVGPPLQVLLEKQRREPPAPGDLVSGLPDDLAALCGELLRRDPARWPEGREVLHRLGGVTGTCGRPAPAAQARPARAPLVGRAGHLRALEDAFT